MLEYWWEAIGMAGEVEDTVAWEDIGFRICVAFTGNQTWEWAMSARQEGDFVEGISLEKGSRSEMIRKEERSISNEEYCRKGSPGAGIREHHSLMISSLLGAAANRGWCTQDVEKGKEGMKDLRWPSSPEERQPRKASPWFSPVL